MLLSLTNKDCLTSIDTISFFFHRPFSLSAFTDKLGSEQICKSGKIKCLFLWQFINFSLWKTFIEFKKINESKEDICLYFIENRVEGVAIIIGSGCQFFLVHFCVMLSKPASLKMLQCWLVGRIRWDLGKSVRAVGCCIPYCHSKISKNQITTFGFFPFLLCQVYFTFLNACQTG